MLKKLFGKRNIGLSSNPIDLTKIYPILKGKSADKDSMPIKNIEEPISERLTDSVSVYYGIDKGDHIEYINRSMLKSIGKSQGELHKLSLTNFTNHVNSKGINLEGDENIQMIKLDQNMESSLLLYDELWVQFINDYDDDIVISVPSREIILMSLASNKTGIGQLIIGAKELYESGRYKVTTELFLRKRDSKLTVLK